MWPFTSKRQAVRALMRTIDQIESDLAVERKITQQLTEALKIAVNPASSVSVQEIIDAAEDFDSAIVVTPDGEYVAPAAYDFEQLAHDMLDWENQFKRPEDQGGASGSWE